MPFETFLALTCIVLNAWAGSNDFCPCSTEECPTLLDNPAYPSDFPIWSFHFEDNTLNSGIEDSLELTLNKGKFMKHPDRHDKVLYCDGSGSCLNTQLYDHIKGANCFTYPNHCEAGGFTLSLWVNMGGKQEISVQDNAQRHIALIVNNGKRGPAITYNYADKLWTIYYRSSNKRVNVLFNGDYNGWHQLGFTITAEKTLCAYLDGTKKGCNEATIASPLLAANPGFFGSLLNVKYWVDDLMFWTHKVFSEEDMLQYYEFGKKPAFPTSKP